MKKIRVIALAVFLVLLNAQVIFAQSNQKQNIPQIPPTPIQVETAQAITFQDSYQATGSISASQGIILTPEITGRITKIYFQSGQFVQKGDPIIQIYGDIIKAQLDKANAELKLQQVNYQRYLQLYQKHFFEKAGLDQMEAQLESAKADVAQLQATLDQTLIRAPFSGKLGLRQVSIGDYIEPTHPIVSLQALDPINVNFSIPETYLNRIKIGDKIVVKSQINPGKQYIGNINAYNSLIDATTRTLDARATIANPEHVLIPGSFATVIIYFGTTASQVIVSQTAILYSSAETYVYKVINGHAVKTQVTLGKKLENNKIIITKGLKPGDQVIVGGQMKLDDNAPVAVIKN